MSAYHVPAGADPDFAALDLVVLVARRHAGRPAAQGAGRNEAGQPDLRRQLPAPRSGHRVLRCPGASGSVARHRARRPPEDRRRHCDDPTDRRGARARPHRASSPQIELQLNSSDRVGLQLSEWIGMGDWRLLFLHRDRLRTATVEDVRRVAAKYFKPSNRTVGALHPDAAARSRRDAGEAGPGVDAEGLQGQRGGGRRRSLRPFAQQHRVAHRALACRRPESCRCCPSRRAATRSSPT